MKVTKINIQEDVAIKFGLNKITMNKLGEIVLLAGKNGAGKTRLLNLIKQQIEETSKIYTQIDTAKQNIERLQSQHGRYAKNKKNLEMQLEEINFQIRTQNEIFEKQPQLKSDIEKKIFELNRQLSDLNSRVEGIVDKLNQTDHGIKNYQEILNSPIPIITDKDREPMKIVDFVPNTTELHDWANLTKNDWMYRANAATSLGVTNLNTATIPLIQKVVEQWINSTHPSLSYSEEQKSRSEKEYDRLQKIIENFLGEQIKLNIDGYSTIFGKPIAQAELSAGQKILLQMCAAIFAQGGNLSNYIIFMDEPENHLHPSAVIDFLDNIKLRNPNGQIWIATHSIPLLSYFDVSALWFIENGSVEFSGKKPEQVLKGLLGDEINIQKLRDFTLLPRELARNRFMFECLCPPNSIETTPDDPQTKQLYEQLKIVWKNATSLNLLDYGAGKGRMISNLADYHNISAKTFNYFAFDHTDNDKHFCIKNIELCYDDANSRYFNSIESLRSKLDDYYFNIVVLSNVLHEIPLSNWCETMKNINTMLRDQGYVLIIEDCLMPIGELPHKNGFLVFNTLHLKKLFSIPSTETRFIKHDARFDSIDQRGRLMAHLIPKEYLNNISVESIISALNELKQTAITEIRKVRSGGASYQNGIIQAFWSQQLANSIISLKELGVE